LAIIIFLTLCNITVGVYMSHKVAGPLFRFVMVTREVANGNLRIQANLRKGDELRELEAAYNDMTERLRSVIRDDRKRLEDVKEALKVIEDTAPKSGKIQEEIQFIRETADKLTKYFTI
jgi:nitrogen fixation/metabolism regulation signal transduction histidine kinase